MFRLRPYQHDIKRTIYDGWSTATRFIIAVLPTGAGKTVTFSDIIKEHKGPSCVIAHRQELVGQISLALARDKVRHKIIGPKEVIKLCVNLHMNKVGMSYYDPSSKCAVAGVNTLTRREVELKTWANSVTLWVQDECHHILKENIWGKAAKMFPNAKGLGVTATPERADGKGLGAHADGIFEKLVVGPGMRCLIKMGYLTDYRIFAPPSDIDLSSVTVSKKTGDYNPAKLKTATRKSHVIGDVVKHYKRIADGKLGVTFATDVETATDIAQQFNESGVPAEVVSAKTLSADRTNIIKRFENREILQLVNVDLFGEGFDLPAIEVVSMARPTQSYALFVQQFGRALRLMVDIDNWDTLTDCQRVNYIAQSTKPHAIIIDHVGNVERHGLPDSPRTWTLDRRDRRKASAPTDVIPVKSCPSCTAVFERLHKACPFCGHISPPMGRSSPEQVDGDLIELDADVLARMRGEIEKVDMDPNLYRVALAEKYVPKIGQLAHVKRHVIRQENQKVLRNTMALWGGYERADGKSDSEIYKTFYFTFGVDMMTAQTLKTTEALELNERINNQLTKRFTMA
jgi:superfamily II DNA or RNA helicase